VVDQRHVVPIARRPGGNAVAPLSTRSARRRGLRIDRRGVEARPLDVANQVAATFPRKTLGVAPWSTRGTRSLPCLSGVLDVEAWGSLDVELKLGRSMWHMVDQGNAVARLSARSARRRGLGIARRGVEARPLDVAMVDQGNVVAHCPPAECSTSRPGDRSTWSGSSAARPGTWSTRETWSLPVCPEWSTSRPGAHSTWS
jgi:hypothetical protein